MLKVSSILAVSATVGVIALKPQSFHTIQKAQTHLHQDSSAPTRHRVNDETVEENYAVGNAGEGETVQDGTIEEVAPQTVSLETGNVALNKKIVAGTHHKKTAHAKRHRVHRSRHHRSKHDRAVHNSAQAPTPVSITAPANTTITANTTNATVSGSPTGEAVPLAPGMVRAHVNLTEPTKLTIESLDDPTADHFATARWNVTQPNFTATVAVADIAALMPPPQRDHRLIRSTKNLWNSISILTYQVRALLKFNKDKLDCHKEKYEALNTTMHTEPPSIGGRAGEDETFGDDNELNRVLAESQHEFSNIDMECVSDPDSDDTSIDCGAEHNQSEENCEEHNECIWQQMRSDDAGEDEQSAPEVELYEAAEPAVSVESPSPPPPPQSVESAANNDD